MSPIRCASRSILTVLALLFPSGLALAGEPTIVKDIVPGPTGSTPVSLSGLGQRAVFWTYESHYEGSTQVYNADLWSSDGTEGGTVRVKDFPQNYGYPYYSAPLGDVVLFWAYSATDGHVLWRTDGTEAGTYLLGDTDPTGPYGHPYQLTQVGDILLFWAFSTTNGYTLWRSDGTVAGTFLLEDTDPTGTGSFAQVAWQRDDVLLFWTYSSTDGYTLWRTDGTEAGTFMLRDTDPTGGEGYPYELTQVGNLLFFWGYDSNNLYTLWRTDGTQAGTYPLAGAVNIYPYPFAALGGALLYWTYDGTDGYTLWRTDGTPPGTTLLADTDPTDLYGDPYAPTTLGNLLLFWSYSYSDGYILWRTDGTPAGTFLLKDTDPGSYGGGVAPTVLGNTLLFWSFSAIDGYTLWRTDGTVAGTYLVKDTDPTGHTGEPYSPTLVGNVILFWSYTPGAGDLLWRTDGTAAGTFLVTDFGGAGPHVYGNQLPVVGGTMLFSMMDASGPTYTYSTWRTDGTVGGTSVVHGGPDGYADREGFLGSTLLYWLLDSTGGYDLWRTDGTAAGTSLLVDTTSSTTAATFLEPAGSSLLLSIDSVGTGFSLWRTDGTPAGTQVLRSGYDVSPYNFTPAGGTILFTASDPATGAELWRLDGGGGPPETPAPPAFTQPTEPPNGSRFTLAAGKNLSFRLSAFDGNAGDVVTLSARGLPVGATLTPALPTSGNPVSASFSWLPGAGDAGEHVLEFVASDGTLEASYRITVTVTFDTDGDGLLDLWETPAPAGDGGYTYEGAFVDLVAMGARPDRKDIFVEIDYMADSTRSQMPRQSAIDRIVAMFASAPTPNPDGSTGISLHVRIDGAVPWTDLLGVTTTSGYDWGAFDDLKAIHFDRALTISTHYCLFVNKLPGGYSGLSRGNGAADFIVSLGGLPATYNREWAEAGTFGHELGHNLGLMHGGNEDVVRKPNYISIMNLPFQLAGMRRFGADGYFDYSRETLPDLDEYRLDETRMVSPTLAGLQTTFWKVSQRWTGTLPAAVDWDFNGTLTTAVVADINNDTRGTILRGWNDWAHLNFTGGSLGAGVILEEPEVTEIEQELDEQEVMELKPAPPAGVSVRAGIGSMRVVWNACGEGLKYNVYRWVGTGAPAKIGSTDRALYTDTTVTRGVAYKYAVTVINGPESDLSATAVATAR